MGGGKVLIFQGYSFLIPKLQWLNKLVVVSVGLSQFLLSPATEGGWWLKFDYWDYLVNVKNSCEIRGYLDSDNVYYTIN